MKMLQQKKRKSWRSEKTSFLKKGKSYGAADSPTYCHHNGWQWTLGQNRKTFPEWRGHHAGMKAMKEIVKHCSQLGVKHLTSMLFHRKLEKKCEEVGGIFQLYGFFCGQGIEGAT
jgi:L-amino acid N-acyltransferase YncA